MMTNSTYSTPGYQNLTIADNSSVHLDKLVDSNSVDYHKPNQDASLGLLYRIEDLFGGLNKTSFKTTSFRYGNHTLALTTDSSMVSYYGLLAGVFLLLGLVVTVSLVLWLRPRHHYHRLSTEDGKVGYEYIWKPLQGGLLDEEYENTFVGVSVPLLQETTKI